MGGVSSAPSDGLAAVLQSMACACSQLASCAYELTIAMSVSPMPMAVERVSVEATSSRASSVTSDTTVTPTHASVMPGAAQQASSSRAQLRG